MFVELRKIHVPPGARVILEDVSWGEFEAILLDLGHWSPKVGSLVFR